MIVVPARMGFVPVMRRIIVGMFLVFLGGMITGRMIFVRMVRAPRGLFLRNCGVRRRGGLNRCGFALCDDSCRADRISRVHI